MKYKHSIYLIDQNNELLFRWIGDYNHKKSLIAYYGAKHIELVNDETKRREIIERTKDKKTIKNESGLYSLILKSHKAESRIFKKWVTTEVLPSLRKTGSYHVHDFPQQQQIRIYSETDLHKKVVEFMRKHLPGHILVPGLGELQDTQPKRSNSYYKGYRGGQPDLMILNNHREHRGFAIELKTPKGTGQMTENQQNYLRTLEQNGFKTLVSNDYDEIIMELTKYFEGVRFRCNHCPKAFKTLGTQESHERGLHAKKRQRDDGFSS